MSIPKQTNADRIRAMSDEELAKYIIVMAKDDYCDRKNCTGRPCWQCRLEWLKKEVGSHKCYHADGDCIHDNCDTCPNLCEVDDG